MVTIKEVIEKELKKIDEKGRLLTQV